jgi:RNA polymerase sigma-70 factor, ECF subfamily
VRGHGGRYPLLADEDLISLLGDGDAQALALLYDRHSRAAFSLAYRRFHKDLARGTKL